MNTGPKRFTQFHGNVSTPPSGGRSHSSRSGNQYHRPLGEVVDQMSAYKIVPGYMPQGATASEIMNQATKIFNDQKAAQKAASADRVAAIKNKIANMSTFDKVKMAAGGALGAYHGYKRNNSIFWAFMWSIAGTSAPLITGAIALAQGFGKKK